MQINNPDEATLKEWMRSAFRFMLESRTLELKLSSLYKAGKITGGVHMGKGHEAFAVSAAIFLKRGYDIYSPFIREQAGRLAWGEDLLEGAQTYLGSVLGPMRGRDTNVHRGHPLEGEIVPISHLGATVAPVAGGLIAKRIQGKLPGPVGLAHVGDGTTSTGAFHEALNLAAVEKLPFICAVTNNQFAYSTPNINEFACKSLVDKAIGYGIEGYEVDGTDLLECLTLFHKIISERRQGAGPALVVANILRLCGHGEHDDAKYIPDSLKNSPLGKDCLVQAERQLKEHEWMNEDELKDLREVTTDKVQKVIAKAQREPTPDPYRENWDTTAHYFESNY